MSRFLLLACLALPLQAEIVDRVVVIVGQEVITELQIDEEIRVTAFINEEAIVRNLAERRAAADRLIDQLLVRHEMEVSHYPLPSSEEVANYIEQVRKAHAPEWSLEHELAAYDLTVSTLREHLALQLTTLRFVEYRFRPDVGVSDTDIDAYYQRELASWKAAHPGTDPPALTISRESIRKDLVAARTDEMLDTWLEESRKQLNITYLDKSLQ